MARIWLLMLMAVGIVMARKIGSDCSKDATGSAVYCGTDQGKEKLVCEGNICKGTYLNNRCTSSTCAATFFCNEYSICEKCPGGCSSCTKADSCIACLSGYYRDSNGSCIALPTNCEKGSASGCSKCRDYYYLDNSQSPATCSSCLANCLTCFNRDYCQTCGSGKYWYGVTQTCSSGIANCISPTTATKCSACAAGYYLHTDGANNQYCRMGPSNCYSVIPKGSCMSCAAGFLLSSYECTSLQVASCKTTTDAKTCSECQPGYYLQKKCDAALANCKVANINGLCDECEDGYYAVSGVCTQCYSSTLCKSCSGHKPQLCSVCAKGYVLTTSSTNTKCEVCGSNCEACPINGASKCDSGRCKSGFRYDSSTQLCVACPTRCATCDSSNTCLTCNDGYYVSGGYCNQGCATGCAACTSSECTKCKDKLVVDMSNPTQCKQDSQCNTTDGQNCSACYDGYYWNSTLRSCSECAGLGSYHIKSCTYDSIIECDKFYGINSSDTSKCYSCQNSNILSCAISASEVNATLCGSDLSVNSTANPRGCITKPNDYCKIAEGTDSMNCTECKGEYLLNSTAFPRVCEDAISNCNAAQTDGTCGSCVTGYYRTTNRKQCVSCKTDNAGCAQCQDFTGECTQCETYYDLNPSTKHCEACGTGCGACTAQLPWVCSSCREGYAEIDYRCKQCLPASNCLTCYESDLSKCKTCADGDYLNGNVCSQCHSSCLTCSGGGDTDCKQCAPGYYPSGGKCVGGLANCQVQETAGVCKECKEGYYFNTTDSICRECSGKSTGDATCNPPLIQNGLTTTLTCTTGRFARDHCGTRLPNCAKAITPERCGECEDGYYLKDDYTCAACSTGCTCLNSSVCLSAISGYYLFTETSGSKTPKLCSSATNMTGCATCSSDTVCTSVNAGYYLSSSLPEQCTSSTTSATCDCGNGKIWDTTACISCGTGCKVCDSFTTCQVCLDNYYLDSGTCKAANSAGCAKAYSMGICGSCKAGYYYDSSANDCSDCSAIVHCKACSSKTSCSVCATGYFVTNGNCSLCTLQNCDSCSSATECDQCATGYFWNQTATNCTQCHTGCLYCSSLSSCMTCDKGYFKDASKHCWKCIENCDVCDNTETCITCSSKHFYHGGKCLGCNEYCVSCLSEDENNCTVCVPNATLVTTTSTSSGKCVCLSGFQLSDDKTMCIIVPTSQFASFFITGLLTFLILLLLLL